MTATPTAMIEQLTALLPAALTAGIGAIALWVAHWVVLGRHEHLDPDRRLPRQLLIGLLGLLLLLALVLALPISDATRGQVLSLLGVVITGVIGLSSTTFVANAMAGVMLRFVGSFRPGDFLRVGEQFGRITERSLLHVEIQTEDRDLTTLPNLYLITNPVTVIHRSGTIVSATVSLGYDVPRGRVEDALRRAAEAAGLKDPFVHVVELGDYSVLYRVAGFLEEVRHLLSARSNLRKQMMDALHAADIEIVSPSFMNQRRLPDGARIIPPAEGKPKADDEADTPEARIFDKADRAERIAALKAEREQLAAELEQDEGADESERAKRERRIAELEQQIASLEAEQDEADSGGRGTAQEGEGSGSTAREDEPGEGRGRKSGA